MGIVLAISGLLIIVLLEMRYQSARGRLLGEVEFLKGPQTYTELASPHTSTESESHFDSLVRINVENLAAYYSLVKVHTNKSFNVAVWVGIVKFAFMGYLLDSGSPYILWSAPATSAKHFTMDL